MKSLPTDDEYLTSLFLRSKAARNPISLGEYIDDRREVVAGRARQGGLVSDDSVSATFNRYVEIVMRDALSPWQLFNGAIIGGLRMFTLGYFDQDPSLRSRLELVPVRVLPTGYLNGFAAPTPRGGMVIALDSGAFTPLDKLLLYYWALRTRQSAQPVCTDHSADEFAGAILRMATDFCRGIEDFYGAATERELKCSSFSEYMQLSHYSIACRQFILLHEYGHVALGHVSSAQVRVAPLPTVGVLKEYHHNAMLEYEADEFALRQFRFAPRVGQDQHSLHTVVYVAGVFLRFLDLCEAMAEREHVSLPDSHPPAISRWTQVKRYVNLADGASPSRVFPVDMYFDEILRLFGLRPSERRM